MSLSPLRRCLDKSYLRRIASYVIDLTRSFNTREGVTKADGTLPSRFFNGALGEEENVLRREDFNRMLPDYYRLRSWPEQGVPQQSSYWRLRNLPSSREKGS